MRKGFLLAVLGCLSCVTPKPGWVYRGKLCEVTVPPSWNIDIARGIAFSADSIVPHVAEMLSLPLAHDVNVHMLQKPFLDDEGVTWGRFTSPPPRIELGSSCLEATRLKMSLAHEIVHHYMARAGWADFPYVLEDLMAEFIAQPLGGVPVDQMLSDAIPTTRTELERVFELTKRDFHARSGEERLHMYLVCLDFIRKVGWTRLVTMLHEGRASRAELLAAYEDATTEHGMTTR